MALTSDQNAPAKTRPPIQWTGARMLAILALCAIVLLCFLGIWLTRDAMSFLPLRKPASTSDSQLTLVDTRPWRTAEQLAAMAVTAEEQTYAHEAERLADHEVDQAFASALRQAQASLQHKVLQGAALAQSRKVAELQRLANEDQARVQSLTGASPNTISPTGTPDDLEVAKAQLSLDSDELADAQEDLARALGDERGRIQQELSAHEAAMKKYDSEAASKRLGAIATSKSYGSLASRVSAWFDQRNRYQLLQEAAQQADADSKAMMADHNALEKQKLPQVDAAADRETRLNAMKSRSMRSQMLSIDDDRLQTQSQLAAVYRKWSAQVLLQHRIVMHLILQSLALLAVVLLCAILLDALLQALLSRPSSERRMYSLRLITRLGIEVIAAGLVLLIMFGTPSQMPTIVGLTTAGLTVVLQDFIISFCGWFVLMGKNGIRQGDWVEINGVGGEVVDVGLFRTSLLETGNWTDHGHPTGRRVTFTNSFAIKGQYFNFTTSGQWMWDEITVTVPTSDDVYSTIELIHKAVLEETETESELAEEEWRRSGRSTTLGNFSAAAAVNMRPSATGIDIIARYVTRAGNRYHVRNCIYQRVIELLHKPVAKG